MRLRRNLHINQEPENLCWILLRSYIIRFFFAPKPADVPVEVSGKGLPRIFLQK